VIRASLLWIAISSLLACLLSLMAGSLRPTIAAVSLVTGLAIAIWSFWFKKPVGLKRESQPPISALTLVIYFVLGVGIYFHSTLLFFRKDDFFWILNPFNLGDMSFHWGSIHYLAKGAAFWPENLIFLGHRFKYPFGMDFFNALWDCLQVPIEVHLPLITLACLILTAVVAHIVGGPFLVAAIFFSSGYFNFIHPPSWDLLQLQDSLAFKNLFLSVLLTQRGFLYALPAGLWIYKSLKDHFVGDRLSLPGQIFLGIIWGALGFFHLHTYFLLSLYFGLWILWKKELKTLLPAVGVAIIVGIPFVINALIPEAGTGSLVHLSRGWTMEEHENPVLYWLRNMGPWLVAMIGTMIFLCFRKQWQKLIPVVTSFILFLIFCHVILAPWDWDNIKLIFWCYLLGWLAISPVIWQGRNLYWKFIVAAICFLPGSLLFVRSLPVFNSGITWASEKEYSKAEFLLRGKDVNAGLAIYPEYHHPGLLLGFKLFMGTPGHVWSHGYSYGDREEALKKLYAGVSPENDGGFQQGVHLIYLGPIERQNYPNAHLPEGFVKINQVMDIELYSPK